MFLTIREHEVAFELLDVEPQTQQIKTVISLFLI